MNVNDDEKNEEERPPIAYGMDVRHWGEKPKKRPALVTDRTPEEEDYSDTVRVLGDAIREEEDKEKRAALWAALPPAYRDDVVEYAIGIPPMPAHHVYATSANGQTFASLDALTPDTVDALASPIYDLHGRPGVILTQGVAALLWDAWQDVCETLDAGTRAIVVTWLTDPRAVRDGSYAYTYIARTVGLCGPRVRVADALTRDVVDRAIRHTTYAVEERMNVLADERPTLGEVRDMRDPSETALTPSQHARAAYLRDYAASWRDLTGPARDNRNGYPWAGSDATSVAPLTWEERTALHGEHARLSQERLRETVRDAIASGWASPVAAPVSAWEERTAFTPAAREDGTPRSAHNALRARFKRGK